MNIPIRLEERDKVHTEKKKHLHISYEDDPEILRRLE